MVSFELADDKQSGSRTISAAFTRLARRVTRPAVVRWMPERAIQNSSARLNGFVEEALAVMLKRLIGAR